MLKRCAARGIDINRRGNENLRQLIMQYDKAEEEWSKIAMDPNFSRVVIDSQHPTLMVVYSRNSSYLDASRIKKWKDEHEKMEKIMRSGQVISGLENTQYIHINRKATLVNPIPLHKRECRRENLIKMMEALDSAEEDTQVKFVSFGIDGILSNIPGWKAFVRKYQSVKRPRLHLVVAESVAQWHWSLILWSLDDWLGPGGGGVDIGFVVYEAPL